MPPVTIPVEKLLGELGDAPAAAWSDRVQQWLDAHAPQMEADKRTDLLLRTPGWSRVPALADERARLCWLLGLAGRWPAPALESQGWPAPIQSRIDRREQAAQARALDAVLLYEAFLHLHFAVLASEFTVAAEAVETSDASRESTAACALGWRVLDIALNDAQCNGGSAWLERSAALTWVLDRLSRTAVGVSPVFPELVAILQPRHLVVHREFTRFKGEMVKSGGPVVRLFELLRRFRNLMHGHADGAGDALASNVIQGLTHVFGLVGRHFEPYRGLALAEAGHRQAAAGDATIALTTLWSPDGRALHSTNQAVAHHFRAVAPELPAGGYSAPRPPALRDWELEWWDRSLLLMARERGAGRHLYLTPWACRLDSRTDVVVPGLLESVHWRSEGLGERYPRAQWRSYLDGGDSARSAAGAAEIAPAAAHGLQALARRARLHATAEQATAPAGDVSAPSDLVRRDFVLGSHAALARERESVSMPRRGVLEALFDAALAESRRRSAGAARLLLVGQSGLGKSVLMAQAFVSQGTRAALLSLDRPIVAESEPATEWTAQPPDGLGASRLREQGVAQAGKPPATVSIAVPARMHWLAVVAQWAGLPAPRQVLGEAEAHAQVVAALTALAKVDARPVWFMVDGVNQTHEPQALLSGLRPLDDLPSNVIVLVSTQDDEGVIHRLSGSERAQERWGRHDLGALAADEVGLMFWHGWPADLSPPTLGKEVLEEVRRRSLGFPFFVRHWAQRLQTLAREEPLRAGALFRRELRQGDTATQYPPGHFRRLVEAAEVDFNPPGLPRLLLWCLSAADVPLSVSDVLAAMPALVAAGFAPASVSRSEVQNALSRLAGFLSVTTRDGVRSYGFTHELLGAVWLRQFGTADDVARLNELLLPQGARPLVQAWPAETCLRWAHAVLFGERSYQQLNNTQCHALTAGLLLRIDHVDGGLEALRPRRLAFWSLAIFFQRKADPTSDVDLAPLQREADEALRMCESAATPAAHALEDAARAVGTLGYVFWQQNDMAASMKSYEQALKLHERLLLQPDADERIRAGYLSAVRNHAILVDRCADAAAAQQAVSSAWLRCPAVETAGDRLQQRQADLLAFEAGLCDQQKQPERARNLWREAVQRYRYLSHRSTEVLEDHASALSSLGYAASSVAQPEDTESERAFAEAAALYRQLQDKGMDRRAVLADTLHSRALALPRNTARREDLVCLTEAIELYRDLVTSAPGFRLSLANALHNYAGRLAADEDPQLRVELYDEAISLYESEPEATGEIRRWKANTCHAAGSQLLKLQQYARAADRLRETVRLRRELVDGGAEALRADLRAALNELAATLRAAGEPSEAADVLVQSVELSREMGAAPGGEQDPLVLQMVRDLDQCLERAGRHDERGTWQRELARLGGATVMPGLDALWDGAWSSADEAAAAPQVAQALAETLGFDAPQARWRRERCLVDALVLELGIAQPDAFAHQKRYLWRRDLLLALDGTSRLLHLARELKWVTLTDAPSAGAWVQLFCENLAAEHGAFLLPRTAGDIPWEPGADTAVREAVAGNLQALAVRFEEDEWRASGDVFYGGAHFRAQFAVRGTGVEMVDDTPLRANLPILAVTCRAGVWRAEPRQTLAPTGGTEPEPQPAERTAPQPVVAGSDVAGRWAALMRRVSAPSGEIRVLQPDEVEWLWSLLGWATSAPGAEQRSGNARSLTCMPNGCLLQLTQASAGSVRHTNLLAHESGLLLLDGTSDPLHAARTQGWIDRSSPEAVRDWVHVFCLHVNAESGAFMPVAGPDDLPWRQPQGRDAVSGIDWPGQLPAPAGDGWSWTANVLYGSALSRCNFAIAADGTIRMEDDDFVCGELDVWRLHAEGPWRWWSPEARSSAPAPV